MNQGHSNFRDKRLLVIDDSRLILKKLQQLFSAFGFKVDTAENGEEAFNKVSENIKYDLIFTDIEMPVLDGIALARKVKALPEYSQIPIIFNSALSNPILIKDIEKEGLGLYIVKFDSDLIIKTLESAFESK